jgi:septum formation protein
MTAFIYLASQSPRRSQLLTQIGVEHRLLLPEPHEDAEALESVQGRESPARYVQRVTALKLDAALARRLSQGLPDAAVLCADTTVALGADILGKPETPAHARRMLAQLSGQTHRVLTAVAVQKGRQRVQALSESWVRFADMTPAQIRAYVATGEPMGKAGAYGIQGRAAGFIAQMRGSYSGIMGLPLFETAQLLRQLGVRC